MRWPGSADGFSAHTPRGGRSVPVDGGALLLIEAPAQLAKLGALDRDHLSDEPPDEEDAAEDQAGLDQGPDRAHALVGDEEGGERTESGQSA
jgi:hypothetical protein